MKIIKRVSVLEIKRCFVVSNLLARRTHRGHMKTAEATDHYLDRLEIVHKKVVQMKESQLDHVIEKEWKKRLDAYNHSRWSLVEISIKEIGVWNRAGELPLRWTNRSLEETAIKVKRALNRKNGFKHKHIRAAHAIRGILKTSVEVIQNEKYLLPIIFSCDTGTGGRKRLKTKMRGDIDDGCMRSIALAVNGSKKILAYFGRPK